MVRTATRDELTEDVEDSDFVVEADRDGTRKVGFDQNLGGGGEPAISPGDVAIGDRVTIGYKSRRNGNHITRTGTVEDVSYNYANGTIHQVVVDEDGAGGGFKFADGTYVLPMATSFSSDGYHTRLGKVFCIAADHADDRDFDLRTNVTDSSELAGCNECGVPVFDPEGDVALCDACEADYRRDKNREVRTDGGRDSPIDHVDDGDRIRINYLSKYDTDVVVAGDVIRTDPAKDPNRRHGSITVRTNHDGGSDYYRIMYNAQVHRSNDNYNYERAGERATVDVVERPTTDGGQTTDTDPAPITVALSMYGDAEPAKTSVVVDDDADTIASVIRRAHDHGYVLSTSEDATDDLSPVKRRLVFGPVSATDLPDDAR